MTDDSLDMVMIGVTGSGEWTFFRVENANDRMDDGTLGISPAGPFGWRPRRQREPSHREDGADALVRGGCPGIGVGFASSALTGRR